MKNYKHKLNFFVFLVFSLLIISPPVFASTTDGTIDPTYRYGWGENVGWVDFGSTAGDIHITDDALSGSAYGENIGWINLSTVTNDKEGNLSGYAWGENIGWIDFSGVTIDSHGYFLGSAYGENIGWISFAKDQANMMLTDWRPKSALSTSGHSSSGSLPMPILISTTLLPITPIVTPPNPSDGQAFNPSTPCLNGALFSTTTGLPCSNVAPVITRNLKLTIPFMKGDDVKTLQTYLNTKDYSTPLLVTDGIYGPKSSLAVIAFQKANNLTPDGIVGPITRSKLIN